MQLTWQALEVYAFEEPELVHRLKLKTEQKKSINDIIQGLKDDIQQAQKESLETKESDPMDVTKPLFEKNRTRILEVLTTEQRMNLMTLLGAPFDASSVRYLACKAPAFQPVEAWLNLNDQPIPSLKGKVTVIHFYAFSCINCIHNLPFYNTWRQEFPADRFQIVGIHRPETENEKDLETVKKKAGEAKMVYPIAVDLESKNWNTWANSIWPSIYLIDKKGFIRYWWYGELNWKGAPTEKMVRKWMGELLEEK